MSKYVVRNFRSLHVPLYRYWNRRKKTFGARKKGARVGPPLRSARFSGLAQIRAWDSVCPPPPPNRTGPVCLCRQDCRLSWPQPLIIYTALDFDFEYISRSNLENPVMGGGGRIPHFTSVPGGLNVCVYRPYTYSQISSQCNISSSARKTLQICFCLLIYH